MIFLTAGGQLPFDRLAEVALEGARSLPEEPVIYQAGPGGTAWFEHRDVPANLAIEEFMEVGRHRKLMVEARWVVSHAGMGSLLPLLEQARPVLVFPRLKRYREHRNDHQLDTAIAMRERFGLTFYTESQALISQLAQTPSATDDSKLELIERRREEFGHRLQGMLESRVR
ncbi:glycosyltransferase [Salinicola halophyticus]|uniref:glycosyltransferase n=1 Tax=Salinicola halophyticus TaxID=1808881 RepID=UPI001300248F|nr:glycosyltransferase [Salinicola halophyticus]